MRQLFLNVKYLNFLEISELKLLKQSCYKRKNISDVFSGRPQPPKEWRNAVSWTRIFFSNNNLTSVLRHIEYIPRPNSIDYIFYSTIGISKISKSCFKQIAANRREKNITKHWCYICKYWPFTLASASQYLDIICFPCLEANDCIPKNLICQLKGLKKKADMRS